MNNQKPKVKLTKKDYLEKKEREQQLANKANREKENRDLIEKNSLEKENEVLLNESKKLQSGIGSEKHYTLVKNSLGQLEKRNDIDAYWVNNDQQHKLSFITYLPNDNLESGSSEESLLFMNSDLSNLLKFKYNVFWSHCIYNNSLQEFLDSFLRFFERDTQPHILLVDNDQSSSTGNQQSSSSKKKGSKDFINSKKILYRRVFLVLLRMSMQQEKSGNFLTRDYYSDTIYQQKLFTIPKIFDICTLFSPHSKSNVQTMVQDLFDVQPLFYKDLDQHMLLITKSLSDVNQSLLNRNYLDLLRLEDNYLMDIVYNINTFLRIFPMGTHSIVDESFKNNEDGGVGGTLAWLTYFYEYIIPIFNKENQKLLNKTNSTTLTPAIYDPLKQHILNIFHCIFKHQFMIKVEQLQLFIQDPCQFCSKKSGGIKEISHRFFSFLGSITSFSQQCIGSTKNNRTKLFNEYFDSIASASILYDYEQTYKLSHFIEKIINLSEDDNDQVSYAYFMQLIGKPVSDKPVQKPKKKSSSQQQSQPQQSTGGINMINKPTILDYDKINQIQSLFPDLGDWFVHSCLKFYNNNVEQVINALCDDSSLPQHLKSMDRSLKSEPTIKSTISPRLNEDNKSTVSIPSASKTTTTNTTTTTTSTTTTTTTTTSTKDPIKKLSTSMERLNIGKKSLHPEFENTSDIEKAKSYIRNYELIYDDEYDDSLEEFSNFKVQDGETYMDNDSEVEGEGNQESKNDNNNNNNSNSNNNKSKDNKNKQSKSSSYSSEPVKSEKKSTSFLPPKKNEKDSTKNNSSSSNNGVNMNNTNSNNRFNNNSSNTSTITTSSTTTTSANPSKQNKETNIFTEEFQVEEDFKANVFPSFGGKILPSEAPRKPHVRENFKPKPRNYQRDNKESQSHNHNHNNDPQHNHQKSQDKQNNNNNNNKKRNQKN